ncbi:MAG TPA: hypothetical protein VGM23_10335 [Armatimonadota bacterium]|jgi:hypothetical protein
MMRKSGVLLLAALLLAALQPAFASFWTIGQPSLTYQRMGHLLAISGPDNIATTSITDGMFTANFSTSLLTGSVPSNTWTNWSSPPFSESATPRILINTTSTVTMNFSEPVKLFGLEIEPYTGTPSITVTYYNGPNIVGAITQSVNTNAGARLFAALTDEQFTSVTISSTTLLAFAELRYSTYAGNVLHWDQVTGRFLLGSMIIPMSGWYPLESPNGAMIFIKVAYARTASTASITLFDDDNNHTAGVQPVVKNTLAFASLLGSLSQKAAVGTSFVNAIYRTKQNETIISNGGILPGFYLLSLTFYDYATIGINVDAVP